MAQNLASHPLLGKLVRINDTAPRSLRQRLVIIRHVIRLDDGSEIYLSDVIYQGNIALYRSEFEPYSRSR